MQDHDGAIRAQYFASGIDHGLIHSRALDLADGIKTVDGQQMTLDCTLLFRRDRPRHGAQSPCG